MNPEELEKGFDQPKRRSIIAQFNLEIVAMPNNENANPESLFADSFEFGGEACDSLGKGAIAVHEGGHIVTLGIGESPSVRLNGLKRGDIVEVGLFGSVERSQFYYEIVCTSENAKPIKTSKQLIMTDDRWQPLCTNALFVVSENGNVVFRHNFEQGGLTGVVRAFHVSLIAKVIGRQLP